MRVKNWHRMQNAADWGCILSITVSVIIMKSDNVRNSLTREDIGMKSVTYWYQFFGNGSFRSRVVSALSRFGPGLFRSGSFRHESFRPLLVGRFGLIFSNPRLVT